MEKEKKRLRTVAVVPAAGWGKRFGPAGNKPFQVLGGKPLLLWTLETLESVGEVDEILPVLQSKDEESVLALCSRAGISKVKRIAPGGEERQHSVYNGLVAIGDSNGLVLVHDGVRPLIERALVEKTIRELQDPVSGSCIDGVILGLPVKDTIKEIEDGIVKKTPKRDSIWAVQTPQVFFFRKLREAYESARKSGFLSTDDSALIERIGGKVRMIMGSYRNIKITTPEDLVIAEALLKTKAARPA